MRNGNDEKRAPQKRERKDETEEMRTKENENRETRKISSQKKMKS